jgi:GNT-I family
LLISVMLPPPSPGHVRPSKPSLLYFSIAGAAILCGTMLLNLLFVAHTPPSSQQIEHSRFLRHQPQIATNSTSSTLNDKCTMSYHVLKRNKQRVSRQIFQNCSQTSLPSHLASHTPSQTALQRVALETSVVPLASRAPSSSPSLSPSVSQSISHTTSAVRARFPVDVSSLTAFVESGGHLPVLVVTRTRTDELAATLSSLLSVRGVTREAVFVVQDGTAADTKAVIDSFGIRCHQKTAQRAPSRYFNTAATRIALHYRYALDYMFDSVTEVC